jgi:hypothetical protein
MVDVSMRPLGFDGFVAVSLGCQFLVRLAVEIGKSGLGRAGIDFSPFQILCRLMKMKYLRMANEPI